MKRFLLTNPRYTGEAVLLYNEHGHLQRIDYSQTNMTLGMIAAFKMSVPPHVDHLSESFTAETIIVESDIVITFEQFWKKYDHKYNKDRCEQLWNRLSKTHKILAFTNLDRYHKFLRKNPGHLKLHPDTYLRSKAWENDYK